MYRSLTEAQRARSTTRKPSLTEFNRMVNRRLITFHDPDRSYCAGYFLSVTGIEAHREVCSETAKRRLD